VNTPRLLYVLGAESWLGWLPAFLSHPAYDHHLVTDPACVPELLRATPYRAVVFLSHHQTLHRDAELAGRLAELSSARIVAHPRAIADLAVDKRKMAGLASGLAGLSTIPEIPPETAAALLRRPGGAPLIAKPRRGTEGIGYRTLRSPADAAGVTEAVASGEMIIQPLIDGVEISVNLIGVAGRVVAYEPVWKGRTGPDEPHPCLRLRHCPAEPEDEGVAARAVACCLGLASRLDLHGLVEIELIWDGQSLYLLEINPRLSATMRMTSVACDRSLFADLGLAAVGLAPPGTWVRATRPAAEFPCPRHVTPDLRSWLEREEGVWVSSRVTLTASSRAELDDRLREVQGRLTGPETDRPVPEP